MARNEIERCCKHCPINVLSILVHSLLDHILILIIILFSVHAWSENIIGHDIRWNFKRISYYICTIEVTYGSWQHTIFILAERDVVGYNIWIELPESHN